MSRQYYSINNLENVQTHPFGYKLEMEKDAEEWVDTLRRGSKVDAIKSDGNCSIWTRATVVDIHDFRIEVKYDNEPNDQEHKLLKKANFELDQFDTYSNSEWTYREKLDVGEYFDFYTNDDGWILMKILAITTDQEEDEFGQEMVIKTVDCEMIDLGYSTNSQKKFYGINVHDPKIREAKRFSSINILMVNDANDTIYRGLDIEDRYAVLRTSNTIPRSSNFPMFINKFGKMMGFDYILER